MSSQNLNQNSPGIDIHEVLFVLFRHKWKIILCSLLGLIAAGVTFFVASRYYQSDAKLLIRYVLERSAVDAVNSQLDTSSRLGDSLIDTEAEILSSGDLAALVAQKIGPERILEGSKEDINLAKAARVVREGLEVTVRKGSNVIQVAYRSKNAEIVQPVLQEYVSQYLEKHLQVHRSQQAFDFVSQQRDQVRARLVDLQEQLKKLKDQAGITSLADSTAALNAQISKVQENLMAAEAGKAEQSARLAHVSKSLGLNEGERKADAEAPAVSSVPSEEAQTYQILTEQIGTLRKAELQLLTKYSAESSVVRGSQSQIRGLEQRKADLEAKYPGLTAVALKTQGDNRQIDVLNEQAGLLATEAKIVALKSQLSQLQAAAAKINAVAAQIEDLERQKQIEEKTYAEVQVRLETQRIDEQLDSSKIPNISEVQKPSPPAIVVGKAKKVAMGMAAGGIAVGLGLALVFGMLLDQTVKRAAELEKRLGIPMMVQIPQQDSPKNRRHHRKRSAASAGNGEAIAPDGSVQTSIAPWDDGHFIKPFAQIIRDRLILAFELKRVTHKPKLVAVTSLSGGEGTSTLAAGLAVALSEMDHGKVLLVDMNCANPALRPFSEERSGAALMDVLQSDGSGIGAAENLYLATGEASNSNRIIAPRRFYEMVPAFRESQFDYIVFDMPPLEQGGATLAVSGFMDKVLLVTETERNNRDALKRAYTDLLAAKADVAAVVNKVRNDVPCWLLG